MSEQITLTDIEQQLKLLFVEQFFLDADSLHPDTEFAELDMDSLELLEFVVAVENIFDVDLDDDSLANCLTLGDAAQLITNMIHQQRGIRS